MTSISSSPLTKIEPRLRTLLPADLYAVVWLDPSPTTLMSVFEHLRTLQRILYDYIPRQVTEALPHPGETRFEWQDGTLMFTDLAGFTPLMEANATHGRAGAETLLRVLNSYFTEMIEIVSKPGGALLEFTGDALLALFTASNRREDTAQAVRAGLRMQRAMSKFANIETPTGKFTLGMRVGIHTGRFLTADIGTPRRMNHVLLGSDVQRTKQAEGAGTVERVNLTDAAYKHVRDVSHFERDKEGYMLVIDDLGDKELGEYDLSLRSRRTASGVLFDRSVEGLLTEIEQQVSVVEPLASYLPMPILNLVVESAAKRQIAPKFVDLTVMFVNLIGLTEAVDHAPAGQEAGLVDSFSRAFALINAAVESRGGVLKHVTYHLAGSDILIYFGVPNSHIDDPERAAAAALAIRDIITNFPPPVVDGKSYSLSCQIGLARGSIFAAEVGELRGRREFNVLGDSVNTAARLMTRADTNQILMTEAVEESIKYHFRCETLGAIKLKGKSAPMPVYTLAGPLEE